jgi:hypothetical protein
MVKTNRVHDCLDKLPPYAVEGQISQIIEHQGLNSVAGFIRAIEENSLLVTRLIEKETQQEVEMEPGDSLILNRVWVNVDGRDVFTHLEADTTQSWGPTRTVRVSLRSR